MVTSLSSIRKVCEYSKRMRKMTQTTAMLFAVATTENKVRILNAENHKVVKRLPTINNRVRSMLFAPWDDNLLAISFDFQVQLWDLASREMRGLLDHKAVKDDEFIDRCEYIHDGAGSFVAMAFGR